jgi:hypothetical protein
MIGNVKDVLVQPSHQNFSTMYLEGFPLLLQFDVIYSAIPHPEGFSLFVNEQHVLYDGGLYDLGFGLSAIGKSHFVFLSPTEYTAFKGEHMEYFL